MWPLIVALAYLNPLSLISPSVAAAASPTRSSELTIEQFAHKLKKAGQVTQFTPVLVTLMGFPQGSTKKTFEAPTSQTDDGVSRIANLVFGNLGSDDPAGFFWNTRRETTETSESYLYRTGLDGGLEKAVRVDGRLEGSGRDVRGASKATALDVGDAEVRERFQRDVLDFWLKGKGRKKAGAKGKPKR